MSEEHSWRDLTPIEAVAMALGRPVEELKAELEAFRKNPRPFPKTALEALIEQREKAEKGKKA